MWLSKKLPSLLLQGNLLRGIDNCSELFAQQVLSRRPFNNYVDKMRVWGVGQKMSVFVHAQGIKTVHEGRGG